MPLFKKIKVHSTTRFVATGRIVYNNKGNVIKQYEPWFSTNELYVAEDELMEYGVTPIMHYDPAGRLIQTNFPDGTTSKVEFNAWEQKNYDQNDCDSSSPHYNTPQTVLISPLSVAFKTIDDNGTFGDVITTQTLNVLGQVIEVEDALERTMTQNVYDMAGQLIMTENIDSSKRWIIYNAAKMPVYVWDSRDQRIKSEFDDLLRPTNTSLKAGSATEKKVQQIEYGTSASLNNIGQVENIFFQDGKTNFFEYDFKNNLLTLKKKFALDYQNVLDYNGTVTLQTEEFITQTSFDALNRPITITQPDSTVITNVYNKGGLLEQVKEGTSYYISNIDYNARGQRTKIVYGNTSETTFSYDDENFRLTRLLTTKSTGSVILQDLNFTYDSVGNIVEVEDEAQQTNYFNNSVIDPISTFEYDALYRLIEATGREQTSLQLPSNTDFVNNIPVPNTGSSAMQNYTQQYSYDKLGNILQMRSFNQWTRDYFYDTATNRLLKHDEQGQPVYTYDAHGNMLTMPHLTSMVWDYKDELVIAGNGTVTSYYNYDAQGDRSRKIVEKPGGIHEERYYFGGYEVYRKFISNSLDKERETVHIMDDRDRFVIIDTLTVENGTTLTTPVETLRYQYSNHLGSACLELDSAAAIISFEEYHPFGTTSYRSGRNEVDVSLKRYKYVGKERDEETGLYYYGARYYAAWLCRWTSTDSLKEKYLTLSPYNYCANNPLKFVDTDGCSIKIFPEGPINAKAFIEVAATKQGGAKLKTLINDKKSLFKIKKISSWQESTFDTYTTTINYKESDWIYLNLNDTWSKSGATIFGHETSHAYDYSTNQLFTPGTRKINTLITETKAGNFENYIRSVYSMSFYRDKYRKNGQTIINYNTSEEFINSETEKITNMKLIDNGTSKLEVLDYSGTLLITEPSYNLNKNQMTGVSYNQSFTNGEGVTTSSTMYMLTWMNNEGEIDFYKTDSFRQYQDKVTTMQGKYTFATERKIIPGIK